jgi:cystathionine beta-lyase
MWVADMDFSPPAEVIQALEDRIQQGEFGYQADPIQAKKAVVEWLFRRHNWQVSPEAVVLLPSVVAGFNLAAQAAASPGESVLVQQPAYRPFFKVAQQAGLVETTDSLMLKDSGKYTIDWDSFSRSLQPDTRLFLLCNPHNPTGRVFTERELLGMAERCLKNQTLICSDEIHSDLVYKGHRHLPIASLDPEIASHTITLISPSKSFNLAGLKTAAAVITNPALRDRFQEAEQGLVTRPNLLGITALQAAYREGDPWLEELLSYLSKNRAQLIKAVREDIAPVRIFPPEGTFLAWMDFRFSGIPDPFQFLLDQAHVAVNPGGWFGPSGKGFVRLNFACPRDRLKEGLRRIQAALAA